ncbi:serine/threonine-protein kinase [Nocardia macrotermitis]|uniref:non-specific serine/threonine protein kinase n=1 Tax=Nocardia macrotermitis TaxID=2585198 RepID=A0A7K0DEU1_9NOCA|nr:serine/threonine-protein kinase [Nocardia macrotermitis]MQY23364.1 Serine/threonine-protein kinase PknD [Nocardia macrotermitis]
MAGQQFGAYRLDRLIGRGSAGEVWLAHDDGTGRAVALKILSPSAAEDPDYRRRFEREANIGARLDNPHVVPIHAFGAHQGRLYLDMAHIPGVDVAHKLRLGPMRAPEAVDLIAQVAQALDAAHAARLVHRDVKPANIIVHPSGFAYLIDFGIARSSNQTTITATGFTIGTLAYMAPERFAGNAEPRSDIYSLTCVLYECLTARRPFGDTDPVQQLHAHLHDDPPHVESAPDALNQVIARGMAKKPQDRYRTAGELATAALAAIGMAQPIPRTPPELEPPGRTRALPPLEGPVPHTRVMPETGSPANRPPHPTRVAPENLAPVAAGPRPTRVLSKPNPDDAEPDVIRAPATHHPVFTPRLLRVIIGLIILAVVVFAVIVGCTPLMSGGGQHVVNPGTTTGHSPTLTSEAPAPTSEPAPTTAPQIPGFTFTFQFPTPTFTFAPPPTFTIPTWQWPPAGQ